MIKLYLWLTLVGLVAVALRYDVSSTSSPINARLDSESAYRPMSGTDDDAVSLPLPTGSSSTGLLNDTRSVTSTVRGKHPWSRLENMELMRCYYEARAAGRGYQKRLKSFWDTRNPDKSFRTTNNLACQARAIINSKLLSEHELHDIQRHCMSTKTDPSPSIDDPLLVECTPDSLSKAPPPEGRASINVTPPYEVLDNSSEFEALLSLVRHCVIDFATSEDLRIAFNQICICLSEVGTVNLTVRQALPKLTQTKVVQKWLCLVNKCVNECIQSEHLSFSQCNCLVYAASLAVVRLSGQSFDEGGRRNDRGAWKVRLESQIQKLRGHLSQLLAIHQSPSLTARLRHLKSSLFRLYHIVDTPSFLIAVETLKQRITCLAARVRRYQTRLLRF